MYGKRRLGGWERRLWDQRNLINGFVGTVRRFDVEKMVADYRYIDNSWSTLIIVENFKYILLSFYILLSSIYI